LPIYDEFREDGSEIVFDKMMVSIDSLTSMIKDKSELEAFDDKKTKRKYPKSPR